MTHILCLMHGPSIGFNDHKGEQPLIQDNIHGSYSRHHMDARCPTIPTETASRDIWLCLSTLWVPDANAHTQMAAIAAILGTRLTCMHCIAGGAFSPTDTTSSVIISRHMPSLQVFWHNPNNTEPCHTTLCRPPRSPFSYPALATGG